MKLSEESCLEKTRKKIKVIYRSLPSRPRIQSSKVLQCLYFFNCDPKHQSCSTACEVVTSPIQEVVFFSKRRKYMGLVYTVNTFLPNFLSREQARVC